MLEGEGVGEGALGCQPEVGQEAVVAGAEPALPREEVIVGCGEPRCRELIDEECAIEVQVPDIV